MSEMELALKREETARKRKNLSEKKAEDERVSWCLVSLFVWVSLRFVSFRLVSFHLDGSLVCFEFAPVFAFAPYSHLHPHSRP